MSWAQRTSWGGNRIQKLKIKKEHVKHVVGAQNQLGGKHGHLSGADTCLRIAKITQRLRKISLTSIKCKLDGTHDERLFF